MPKLSYADQDGDYTLRRPIPSATVGDPIRMALSRGAREAWATPEGYARREQLRSASRGAAIEMSRRIAPFRRQISDSFRAVGPSLSQAYRAIWSGAVY